MEMWHRSGQALVAQIRTAVTAPGEIALWYIGQCGYVIRAGETTIFLDPVLNDLTGPDGTTRRHYPAPFAPGDLKPDYVLCSHAHADHMAVPTLQGIVRAFPATKFVYPVGCGQAADRCGIPEGNRLPLAPGQERSLGSFTVKAMWASHPTHAEGEDMALCYQLNLDGIRVTALGDTYLTERLLRDLEAAAPHHIFLPPINGADAFRTLRNCIGNLEAEEAAKLAVHLGAELSIPTHYDMVMDNTVDPLRFAAELRRLDPAARWKIPALGEQLRFRL